tara:strand:- start:7197 stop:7703 length:507 start_codon:yes stop_codon:yes gene_type:complete
MKKIFLIGRRRTGLKTIQKALQVLKYKKSSMLLDSKSLDIKDIIKDMKGLDICAIVKDYTMNDVRAIEAAYPNSTFILTERHSDIWYASFVRYYGTLKGEHPQTVHTNKGHFVSSFYEGFNRDIKTHFHGREWKLLNIVLDGSHSWQSICSYLKKATPKSSFPHENRS